MQGETIGMDPMPMPMSNADMMASMGMTMDFKSHFNHILFKSWAAHTKM